MSPFAFAAAKPVRVWRSSCLAPSRVACCAAKEKTETPKTSKRKRAKNLSPNARKITDVKVGDEFIGTIRASGPAKSSWVDIDVVTATGTSVNARLRLPRDRAGKVREESEGSVVSVHVHKLNVASARIEVQKGTKPLAPVTENFRLLESVVVGEKITGEVVAVGRYGAVIDAKINRYGKGGRLEPCTGLLQRSDFQEQWACAADLVRKSDTERIIDIGDVLDLWIRRCHVRNAFLLFDSKEVDKNEVDDKIRQRKQYLRKLARRPLLKSLKVGEVRKGSVIRIQRYGVFIDIGARRNGLLHYTDMGDRHKRDWRELLALETDVTVEVVKVEDNRLSLRLLSVKDEVLQEASQKAQAATARLEDVKKLQELEVQSNRLDARRQKKKAIPLATQGDPENSEPSPSISAESNISTDDADSRIVVEDRRGDVIDDVVGDVVDDVEDDGDDDGDDDDDDDGDNEEQEKFSDEYFEDKYGF